MNLFDDFAECRDLDNAHPVTQTCKLLRPLAPLVPLQEEYP